MMVNKKILSRRNNSKQLLLIGLIVCMTFFLVNVVSAFNWNDNLVSYYKMDDNLATTNIIDIAGTNDGILSGGNNTNDISVAGKINLSLNLDGSTDYIDLNNESPILGTDVTISAWIKTDKITGTQTIIRKRPSLFYLRLEDDDVSFYADASEVTTTGVITTGVWYFVTGVLRGGVSEIYINGELNGISGTSGASIGGNTDDLLIGRNGVFDHYFDGAIDEVGMWDRALTTGEITELYNSSSGLIYNSTMTNIILESPINQSILSNQSINFITSGNNITSLGYEWKNITYYIWNSTGLFNQTFIDITDEVIFNETLLINNFTIGNYKWNVYGCYGNVTYNNCTFSENNNTFKWRPFEIVSQNYTAFVYETDKQRFNLNINTLQEVLSVSSKLNYNGTLYDATTSCSAGLCNIYSNIDIPLLSTGESINKTIYWEITVYDGTNSYLFNTEDESFQQNVTRIHLEECGGVYTTPTVNFTAYYETNLTRINPFYIAGTFKTWLGSGDVYRTSSFNEASTADLKLCITPTNKTQYSDAHIEYKFNNENVTFIPRNYFFQNKTLTNISEEINLFLLEAEDSTSFIIKVQDQKLSPVAEALVYIQKYYPSDGEYRTVQIAKTDSNGETLGFYETETTDYKHTIIKNGVILLETAQQKVVGKSVPFTLTFTIGQALGYPWNSFEDNINVDTNLTFDKDNNIVTFNYIENTTGYVTSGQLLVFQNSLTNSTSMIVCNVSSSEASATLTCDLTGYDGTFTAVTYINGEAQNILEFIITDAREIFGDDGLFLGMMIILVAGFAMMWNPSAGIISINAAVIFVNMIGFISVSPIFIFGMISISIITIILLKT